MGQIFGDFEVITMPQQEYLALSFSPSLVPLKQRWRNCGLSANFLADYLSTFYPAKETEPGSFKKQKCIKGASNFIANELLENALKNNDLESQLPISLQVKFQTDRIIFYVTNGISSERIIDFQSFINVLLNTDPNILYVQLVEGQEEEGDDVHSGLGLLTIIRDYPTKLAWQFETNSQQITEVTTMVQLKI